jgi:hypothetical protein
MPYDVQVGYGQLPQKAQQWDENAAMVKHISEEGSALGYHWEPGILASFVRAYNQACEEVSQVCGDGCRQMQRIAQALMASYNGYVKTEQDNIQQSRTLVTELPEP